MSDPRPIIIAASNADGDWISLELPWDATGYDLAHAYRTVAFWLTYEPDDVVPDGCREWKYVDEEEVSHED